MIIFEALFGCHDVLIFGTCPIKWWQRPDMTIAVDWDVKHQFKQKHINNSDEFEFQPDLTSDCEVKSP